MPACKAGGHKFKSQGDLNKIFLLGLRKKSSSVEVGYEPNPTLSSSKKSDENSNIKGILGMKSSRFHTSNHAFGFVERSFIL